MKLGPAFTSLLSIPYVVDQRNKTYKKSVNFFTDPISFAI